MSERIETVAEISLDAPEGLREIAKRRMYLNVADVLARHLQDNQGAYVVYRLSQRLGESRQPWGTSGLAEVYHLRVDALHYRYEQQVTVDWRGDWDEAILSDKYVPMWQTIANHFPPKPVYIRPWKPRKPSAAGMTTFMVLRELGRRYRRFLLRHSKPVDPPDRSREQQAILDWSKR